MLWRVFACRAQTFYPDPQRALGRHAHFAAAAHHADTLFFRSPPPGYCCHGFRQLLLLTPCFSFDAVLAFFADAADAIIARFDPILSSPFAATTNSRAFI